MKKVFSLIATAILAVGFTACSQSDSLEDTGFSTSATSIDNAIQFGTYMGKVGTTRAGYEGAITATELQDGKAGTKTKGFGVFAFNTGASDWSTAGASAKPNFMWNQQVYYDASSWKYEPVKYWPNGIDAANAADTPSNTATESAVQNLSFFAYAPYVAPNTDGSFDPAQTSGITALTGNNADGDPKVTYKLNVASGKTAADNVDLLWGTRGDATYSETDGSNNTVSPLPTASPYAYNVDLTKQNTTEKVNFLFKHALAKIGGLNGLKVQLDVDNNAGGALDSKSNVSVQSIVIKGVADKIATTGVFDIATGTWSGVALDDTYDETELFNVTHETPNVNGNIFTAVGTPFTYDGSVWNKSGVTSTTATSIFTSGTQKEFYLLPGVAGQQLKVAITYQVRTYDTNLNGSYSTVNQTITNIVTLPVLAVNHYYTLIMHLGLTSVKFEAAVSTWDEDGSGEEQKVWLPSNVVPGS